jgi:N-acetylmuramic acid 6-phosphate etherase
VSTTEAASPRYADIEDWSTKELVDGIIDSQIEGLGAVRTAAPQIAAAIEAATGRLRQGGRLVYMGAGTSGRIATQDAAELAPTFNWPYERAIPLMAGGEHALLRAVEGAEDDAEAARVALRSIGLESRDVVLSIAASGRTPYAIAALEHAHAVGALGIAIFNNPGSLLAAVADIPILVDTGPELIAGSTRLKAGTAQKLVLNCISTGVMIRLGYVYRGLMVEMKPTNDKLRERAELMVAELAGTDIETARKALAEGGSIKTATVMLLKRVSSTEAVTLLQGAGGNLRTALATA